MHVFSLEQALNDDEVDEISAFLKNCGPSPINLEALDGFFCALICAPGVINPSQWLSSISYISKCDKKFIFDNQENEKRTMGLLVRYWNLLDCNLRSTLTDPDIFIVKHGHKWRGEWARGFIHGAAIRPSLWDGPMERQELGGLLTPMILVCAASNDDPTSVTLPIERREQTCFQMLRNFAIIYRRFEGLRRTTPSGFQTCEVISDTMPACNGDQSEAGRQSRISWRGLNTKMSGLGLRTP